MNTTPNTALKVSINLTNNQINTINRYFDSKHMDRRQLEAVLDFDNLTMDEKYISEVRDLFKSNENESIIYVSISDEKYRRLLYASTIAYLLFLFHL